MRAVVRIDHCRRSAKPIFSYPTGVPPYNSGSRDTTICADFGRQVAKTPAYAVVCPFLFLLHCMITIHQHHRQTDGRHACSMSTTSIRHVALEFWINVTTVCEILTNIATCYFVHLCFVEISSSSTLRSGAFETAIILIVLLIVFVVLIVICISCRNRIATICPRAYSLLVTLI